MISNEQACQLLAHQERTLPGPYLFLGFGKLGEQPVTAKAEALDAPAHETLEAVYREFRRVVPQGRFAIWVGYQLNPKTFRPQEFLALDSQLCDKAFAAPTPAAPRNPT
jgi:hypothetical protein